MEFLFLLFCLGVPKNATYEKRGRRNGQKNAMCLRTFHFPQKSGVLSRVKFGYLNDKRSPLDHMARSSKQTRKCALKKVTKKSTSSSSSALGIATTYVDAAVALRKMELRERMPPSVSRILTIIISLSRTPFLRYVLLHL